MLNRCLMFSALLMLTASAAWGGNSTPDGEIRGILARALALREGYDLTEELRVVQTDTQGRKRVIVAETAQKSTDGLLKTLIRFKEPYSLRGTRLLIIEAEGRSDDHFMFLKSQQKVRRVRATRRDSFMGTDFSLEDLEEREVDDFVVLAAESSHEGGEEVMRVDVEPRYDSGYARLRYVIARSDDFTLRIEYFKENSPEPVKEYIALREDVLKEKGVTLARHALVENRRRGTTTHIHVVQLAVNPEIPDSMFTTASLYTDRPLPGLK